MCLRTLAAILPATVTFEEADTNSFVLNCGPALYGITPNATLVGCVASSAGVSLVLLPDGTQVISAANFANVVGTCLSPCAGVTSCSAVRGASGTCVAYPEASGPEDYYCACNAGSRESTIAINGVLVPSCACALPFPSSSPPPPAAHTQTCVVAQWCVCIDNAGVTPYPSPRFPPSGLTS